MRRAWSLAAAGWLAALPAASEEMPAPRTLEELKDAVQKVVAKEKVPGVGLALVRRDETVWAGGFGRADVASGRDVTADTHFRVGSVSKTFVAAALMKLAEEGKLDLNARLADVAPELEVRNRWESSQPVRVVNVLEHTAGFDDMHFNEAYNLHDPPDLPLREVLAKNPRSRVVRWPPGTRMAYSNPGYGIAGYVIEKLSGRPYERYIEEVVLEPLGMTDSSFRLDDEARKRLATGYGGPPSRPVEWLPIYLRPAGNLNSSPREMALFVRMLLNRGRAGDKAILTPESLSRMERAETTLAARAGLRAGYGLALHPWLDLPVRVLGHDGGIEGFLSSFGYAPEEGFGYVVLLNSTAAAKGRAEIRDLIVAFLSAGSPRPAPPATTLPAGALERFAGYYRDASPRNEVTRFLGVLLGRTLYVKDGKLHQKTLFGKAIALVPVSATSFRLEKQREASMVFTRDPDGRQVLAGSGLYLEKTSPWPARLLVGLLAVCLAAMASAPVFALFWVPRKLLGRMKDARHLAVRAVPLLATLSLAGAFALLLRTPYPHFGEKNLGTVGFWALGWSFAVLAAWGLWLSLRAVRSGVRFHSLLVATANCVVAFYLAYWGVIGFRTWAD